MRQLAEMSQRYAGGNVRTTIEQNLVFRWVPQHKVPDLYRELQAIGLSEATAGTIVDVAACPGTDTCKLGIASSRGLAKELRSRLSESAIAKNQATANLHIKVSGCFNSCGQHHVADIGFYGNSRNVSGYTVPHFQVMLGGQWSENAASYALAMGAVPSKRVPELVNALTERFTRDKQDGETFQKFCQRIGKKALKAIVDPFTTVPAHNADPSFYSDWGDPRQFSIGDMGAGECAGEIVSLAQFGFTAAETEAFEAQLLLDEGKFQEADYRAYEAMVKSAHALVQLEWKDAPTDDSTVVPEFIKRFVDTKIFWHRQHANQFSNYLVSRFENGPDKRFTRDTAAKTVEEANLFIDAAHQAHAAWQQKLNVLKEPAAV